MSEMKYNFAGIEAGAGSILGTVNTTQGLLDEGKQSLGKLATAWAVAARTLTRTSSGAGTRPLTN